MNHTYRLVYNAALNMFVVASELARGRGKGGRRKPGTVKAAAGAAAAPAGTFYRRSALGLAALLLASGPALAHTISIGYENSGNNALTFWYGSYHVDTDFPEGSMSLTSNNGFSATLPYDQVVNSKPDGLVDGSTNFFSGGTSSALSPIPTHPQLAATWQGIQFTGLAAGTYTFTYIPIPQPTAEWEPINQAVLSNSVTVITADLNVGTPRVGPGQTVNEFTAPVPLIFTGGTLRPTTTTTMIQLVSVADAGGTIDTDGHDLTLNGNIDGRGVLTKSGNGTLYMQGANTSVGGMALNGGVVNVDADARLGAPDADLSFNGGTLQLGAGFNLNPARAITLNSGGGTIDTQGFNTTVSQGVTGTGALNKTGSGAMDLTGNNTFSGGLNINGGTVRAASDSNLGTGAISIGNGTLQATGNLNTDNAVSLNSAHSGIDTQGNAVTMTGVVSGNGGLDKTGAGTLTLTNANTYTGTTSIAQGTLALAGNGGIASSDKVDVAGNLNIAGTSNGASIQSLSGNGGVTLGGKNLTLSNAHDTFGGVIAGSGGVNVTGGSETLSGANTYTGATTIGTGAALALAGNGSIAASSGVTANGTFDIGGANAGTTTIRTLDGTGTGAVALGGNSLTLTNASGNFGGAISGSGGVNVAGGNETLSGANTYTGATTIANGATLALSGNGGIAASSGVAVNGTLDIGGTTAGANIQSLTGNGGVALGGKDLTLTNAGGTFGGVIAGSGGVNVASGSETLTGANTYTGATTIGNGATLALTGNGSMGASSGVTANGTFDIGGANANTTIRTLDGAGTGAVTLGANDLSLSNASGNFGGAIGGSGGVNVNGGTQTLSGNSSYTGGTTVTNATVRINADQGLGAASGGLTLDNGTLQTGGTVSTARNITLAGNGVFATDGGTTLTSTGAINGSGRLTKDGAGTVDVSGVASHAGGTVVNGGQLVLNGDNTYTGGNIVNGGATLAVGKDSSLGNAGNDVALNGGTLRATESFGSARDIALAGGGHINVDGGKALALGGAVSGNGDLSKDGAGVAVLNGVVSHNGNVVVSNGTLALNADNSHTGNNIVNSGAALVIGKDSSLGNQANAIVLSGGVLQATDTFATNRNIAVNGVGYIGVDAGKTVESSGTVSGNGALVKNGPGTLQLDGVASHTGGTVVNGGLLALNGDNTYTGGNVVNAGATLQVGKDAALGDAANGVALNSGTLHATGSFDTARAIGLTGAGVVDVDSGAAVTSTGPVSGNGALVKNGVGSLTLDGVASHTGGTYVNGGLLALNGDNTYTGGNVVNSGATLQVGKDAALGDAANGVALSNGTLQAIGSFDTSRPLALAGEAHVDTVSGATVKSAGTVAGNGALVKDGAGTLVLDGVVSHAGGNTINAGTLVLNGANNYTGGNTVNSGATLQVASDASLGNAANNVVLAGGRLRTTTTFDTNRNIALAGNAHIDTVDGTTLTAMGMVSGSGRLFKEGSGTLILGGDNINWTGGTTIDAGVVRVISSTGIGTGDVVLNGGMIEATVTLTTGQKINVAGNTRLFTQAGTTTTLTGDMQSMNAAGISSCFIKSGAGTLNMTGMATLRNGTCVQEGMLRANGVLNSVVTVDEGAYLRGSGLITGPVAVSGTLAPGNSPGTLTATSTITMAPTSTFQADINGLGTASGPGNYSRLLITGTGNQIVINSGATLAPNLVAITGTDTYTPYVPALGDSFRVITAEGGIVGRFAPLAQPAGLAANTRMVAFYNAQNSNSLDLRVVPVSYASYFGSGANSNIRSVSGALDGAINANDNASATASQLALAYAVAGANASQLPTLAAALSGQVHGALAAVAPLAGQSLQGTVSRQLAGASAAGSAAARGVDPATVAPAQALWADLSANHGRWDGDASASSFDANRTQLTVGADLAQGAAGRFGAGLSYARTNVSAMAGAGSVEQSMLFVYGEKAVGPVTLDGLASFGRSTWNSRRADPFLVVGSLDNDAKGRDSMVSVGIRAPWQVAGMTLEPFARVAYQKSRRDGFQENSATSAAMQLSAYDASGTRVLAGLSGGSKVRDPLAGQTTVRYSVGLGRDSGSLVRPEVGASLAGVGTTILTPEIGRTFVQANVEGTAGIGKMSYAYFGLAGEARSGKTDVGVTGGVRIRF